MEVEPGGDYVVNGLVAKPELNGVFQCVHGLQVCDSCYLDFTTVNQLAQLKYNKKDMTTSIHAVEQVNEVHFLTFDFNGD